MIDLDAIRARNYFADVDELRQFVTDLLDAYADLALDRNHLAQQHRDRAAADKRSAPLLELARAEADRAHRLHDETGEELDRVTADRRQWVRLAGRLARALAEAHAAGLADQRTRDRWSDLLGQHVERVMTAAGRERTDWPEWHARMLGDRAEPAAEASPVVAR
jgi:hypothetical protein